MLKLPDLIDILKSSRRHAEDLVDRLNCLITWYFLIFFAVVTATTQTFGEPINCFTPAEAPGTWMKYFNDYCYIQNKIVIHTTYRGYMWHQGIDGDDQSQNVMIYYQWVPYILILQAFLFLVPRIVWTLLMSWFNIPNDIESTLGDIVEIRKLSGEKRVKELERISEFIYEAYRLAAPAKFSSFNRSLTFSYVIRKWIAVANIVGQFFLLAAIIPNHFNLFWGFDILQYRWETVDDDIDTVQSFFPILVRCDVTRMAQGGNLQTYKFPCVIMMNFINEKIFVLIYFWLIFLFVISLLSALRLTLFLISSSYRSFIADFILPDQNLLVSESTKEMGIQIHPISGRAAMDHFITNILRTDGILFMNFVFQQAGGLVAHEFTCYLWKASGQRPAGSRDVKKDENEGPYYLGKSLHTNPLFVNKAGQTEDIPLEEKPAVDFTKITLRAEKPNSSPSLASLLNHDERELQTFNPPDDNNN